MSTARTTERHAKLRGEYQDLCLRYMRATREFPGLRHDGHEPTPDGRYMGQREADSIMKATRREFHRTI
jgi:hypothetical protein